MPDSVVRKEIAIELLSAQDTEQLGFRLAQLIGSHCLITLKGPLGAGKTTFTKGIGKGLGVESVITSPTFTMFNEYDDGRIPLYHLDLYRLTEAAESVESNPAGNLSHVMAELHEVMSRPGLVIIEWPEAIELQLENQERISIVLSYLASSSMYSSRGGELSENARTAAITTFGEHGAAIVESLRNVYFS